MTSIVNPNTGRKIKPGTKLYKQLVKDQQDQMNMEHAFSDLYSFGIHELWILIVLRVDPCLLATLSLVNKFTKKIIYEKYPLEKWAEYGIVNRWKFIYRRQFSHSALRIANMSRFLPARIWRTTKMQIQTHLIRYMLRYLVDVNLLHFCCPMLTGDEKNLTNCHFMCVPRKKKVFFYGCFLYGYVHPTNLDQCIVVDKRASVVDVSCYIRTPKYKDGKPIYLNLSATSLLPTDVTEYFDDVW